mmetsp:Transcript_9830/g.19323  ORF Transcript_9830/g.19323 Transcript_9830/m.19323 type:complete len:524 (-) Transcript_9830:262-1833(-)|eukprot:CAMPEP_0171569138 /NCGR_PEP_ID=MMETSP0961-20121227/2177_1 /TAXON_ID=87120 /ORGANISM="Aurantiochytrium limacinum, Strain ATCCMYA-1381" /LENGTH=523 /DNA_ID=CAMNT_0012123393 /DNA_START=181 /DNA_END=1752 /DNA_ORIENTATION=+
MKAVRRARQRKLEEHKSILESLDGAHTGQKLVSWQFLGLCSCVWIHADDDEGLFDPAKTKALQEETKDENYRVDTAKLNLGKLLGQGGNGCVYVGSYYGYPVAVKEMLSDVGFASDTPSAEEEHGATFEERERARDARVNEEFTREFNNLRKLRHPNVVDMYGTAIIEQDETHSFRRLLVMELCACSMRDVLRDTNAIVPMGTALTWAKQVAAGLLSVHMHGLIHFDIKPANILIDMGGRAKVADLGIARQTKLKTPSSLTFHSDLRIGTPSYMAPELLRGDVERISNRVDVYSFGILLWEVIHRDRPHPDWSLPELFREVASRGWRPSIEPDVPQGFRQLLEKCWHESPNERPTTERLLEALEVLVPEQFPQLASVQEPVNAENFYIWDPEAKTFLGDALFSAQQPNGLLEIEFEDGQPGLCDIDGRNIVLARELDDDFFTSNQNQMEEDSEVEVTAPSTDLEIDMAIDANVHETHHELLEVPIGGSKIIADDDEGNIINGDGAESDASVEHASSKYALVNM